MRPQANKCLIYLSTDVHLDSQFPFKPGDDLWVRVDPKTKRLVIERVLASKAQKAARG